MIRNESKRTIFDSSRLQLISKSDTKRCASEDSSSQGVDYEIPWVEKENKILGWIMRSLGLKRKTKYSLQCASTIQNIP